MERAYTPDRSTSLRHFMTVIFKRLWIISVIALLTLAAGAFKILRTPDQYEARAKLLLERDPELEKALLLRISSSGRSEASSYSYTQESEIMTSRPVLERVVLSLKLYGFDDTTKYTNPHQREAAMQEAVRNVGEHLTISPSPDPNIIYVRYKDQDSRLCAQVVNELVDRYIEYRFKIFSDEQSIAFLDQQISEAVGRLNDLQARRADFRSGGTLYSPDREGDLLFTKLSEYENRADAVKLDKITKEAQLRTLNNLIQESSYNDLPAIDLGADNTRLQSILSLRDQLSTLIYERERLRQKYTDSYDEVKDKDEEISGLRSRIAAEIKDIIGVLQSSISSLTSEEATLRKSGDAIRGQIRGLSGKELELQKLSRGINEAEELYSMLLKQREEARLSKSKKEMVVRVKIISPAVVPMEPIATNKWLKLLLVFFFGLFAGISLAFFTDFFDHSFKNAEDVQRYLDLETLASIRSFQSK
ncbi:MAG: GumC family protein [bacterium]|nr:GumC family protein [bacterium]